MSYENLNFLKKGDMIYLNTISKEAENIPFFFIKDDLSNLKKIGDNPIIQCKGLIFETLKGISLLIMFRFNNDDNLIYCQWFNYYNRFDREKLDMLVLGSKLNFCTINYENKQFSTFESDNGLSFLIRSYSKRSSSHTKWTDEDFKEFSDKITLEYNNRVVLFHESKYHSM